MTNVNAATTSLTVQGNVTLTANFTVSSGGGGTPVPVDISNGFNMSIWCSPSMYNTLVASNSLFINKFGGKLQGFAYQLGSGNNRFLVTDTSVAETPAVAAAPLILPANWVSSPPRLGHADDQAQAWLSRK